MAKRRIMETTPYDIAPRASSFLTPKDLGETSMASPPTGAPNKRRVG